MPTVPVYCGRLLQMAPRPARWYSRFPKNSQIPDQLKRCGMWKLELPHTAVAKPPVDHEGVHGEHDQPAEDGHADAEERDDSGEQEDGRNRKAPSQEEANRGRVLRLVEQPVVPCRVPVYGSQEQPAPGEGR